MLKLASIAGVMLFASSVAASPGQTAPYAGQDRREIKALSAEDVQGYLDGSGLGFAKTAELNHFPGPRHVLEHAQALGLSDAQKESTARIFAAMQSEAKRLGAAYIEKERELDRLFASGEIGSEILQSTLEQIGRIQARIRRVHLQAHLEQKALLTTEQVARYDSLRGYNGGTESSGHSPSHKH